MYIYYVKQKILEMEDIWLSPYGEVIICGSFTHETKANALLAEKYPRMYTKDFQPTEECFEYCKNKGLSSDLAFHTEDFLVALGYIKYSNLYKKFVHHSPGWILEYIGWGIIVKPTQAQIDKMFELTGFLYQNNDLL